MSIRIATLVGKPEGIMANDLLQLLQIHEFLEGALREHGTRMSRADVARLRSNRDQAFLDILKHKSDELQVTMAQLQFLLTAAIGLIADFGQGAGIARGLSGAFCPPRRVLDPDAGSLRDRWSAGTTVLEQPA